MAVEVISKLTDMRSSGIASISKIEKMRTNARTRLIWISNARTDRQLLAYNYGVEAIKELIGSLEDVRRFDAVLTVASGDVPKSVLNMREKDRPKVPHVFTGDICQRLILWIWSRGADQVSFESDAVDEILKVATLMGQKYSATIPIVEQADQRIKVARLSAALAGRTFSTDDNVTLVVRKCHVEIIAEYLDRIYSAKACSYDRYSKNVFAELNMHDPEEVKNAIKSMPFCKDVVRQLLEVHSFTIFDLMDWTDADRELVKPVLSVLIRKNAIKRGKGAYIKTPAFIAMLRSLDETELENKTLDELEGDTDGL